MLQPEQNESPRDELPPSLTSSGVIRVSLALTEDGSEYLADRIQSRYRDDLQTRRLRAVRLEA